MTSYETRSLERRASRRPEAKIPTPEMVAYWRGCPAGTHRNYRRFAEQFGLDLVCNLNGRPESGEALDYAEASIGLVDAEIDARLPAEERQTVCLLYGHPRSEEVEAYAAEHGLRCQMVLTDREPGVWIEARYGQNHGRMSQRICHSPAVTEEFLRYRRAVEELTAG